MADSRIQRRIRWGVNALILVATVVLILLALFIPGFAIAMGLSAALTAVVMGGIGVGVGLLWNVAFSFFNWLMTRHERLTKGTSILEDQESPRQARQEGVSHSTPSQQPTALYSSLSSPILKSTPEIVKLAFYVVQGKQAEAEAMIKGNPNLLKQKCQVVDYSGRTLEGTPLQLALWAEDVKFHEKEVCMVEMIIPYLIHLQNGKAEKDSQILEQFPEGWEAEEEARLQKDEEELSKVVQGIENSTTDEEAQPYLKAWEAYLAKQKEGIIKTGRQVSSQLVVKAFELFDKKFDELGGYDSRKNNLVWRRVVGGAQRYLPTCYAQALCQGPYAIVEGKEFLRRSLEFRYSSGTVFYPLDLDPSFRLGEDYAAAVARGMAWGGRVGRVRAGGGDVFYKLCQTKNSKHSELIMPRADNQSRTQGHVM